MSSSPTGIYSTQRIQHRTTIRPRLDDEALHMTRATLMMSISPVIEGFTRVLSPNIIS